MKNLRTLMQSIGAREILPGDATIKDLRSDSREVTPGCLFLARVGARSDGHAYLRAAKEKGAAAVLVTNEEAVPKDLGIPAYCVDAQDPTYGLLADAFFDHPTRALKVYGVTGTNGKTSTAWMLDHLLRACGRRTALISTLMYRVDEQMFPAPNTTPDAVVIHRLARRAVDAGCDALVMEVSSHGIVLGRIAGVQFAAGGFTNFSRDHLDFHGDEAAYLRAKALFFSLFMQQPGARSHAVAIAGPTYEALADLIAQGPVFDASTAYLKTLHSADAPRVALTGVSIGDQPPRAVHVAIDGPAGIDGSQIRVLTQHATTDVDAVAGRVPVAGRFQVENAALAMTMIAQTEQIPWARLIDALGTFGGVPGRLERVVAPQGDEAHVFVDYAHTPDALASVLQTLRALDAHPLSVVVGCGGDRDAGKRPQMAHVAQTHADRCIFTTDNPRTEDPNKILDAMYADGVDVQKVERIEDRRAAIARGIDVAAQGVCVIAGKGHEAYQEIDGQRWFWNDADEARMAIARRRYAQPMDRRLSGWSKEHLAQVVQGTWNAADASPLFGGLSTDTRNLQRGDLFVALKGPRFDAHDHLDKAFAQGASAAIVERFVPEVSGPQLLVDSPYRALGDIARVLLSEARAAQGGLQIIALTGSNGKTTTRTFAAALAELRDGRPALATHGNFNNQIGLPLSVSVLSTAHHRAILEMGANQHGDIRELVQMAPPDVAVLTSIAPSHLEGFGSVDGIRRAKAEMIRDAAPSVVILPHAELAGIWGEAAREANATILTFGDHPDASLRCTRETVDGPVRLQGQHVWQGVDLQVDVPIAGRHNAGNLAAAMLATSVQDGVLGEPLSGEVLTRFSSTLVPAPGRMERYVSQERLVLFDAYNANPGSVRAALDVLDASPAPRVAVLGGLLELGAEESALHAAVLQEAAARCDVVVTVGARWPEHACAHVFRCADREEAVARVVEQTPKGATLLWKGSRGARLELARDRVESLWQKEGKTP